MLMLLLACVSSLQDLDGDRWTTVAGDCDDDDPAVFPDADEYCNGYDDDCDGTIDGADAVDQGWVDLDGDGLGSFFGCDDQSRYVSEGGDCDDTDGGVQQGVLLYTDADGDGFGAGTGVVRCPAEGLVENDQDCADDNADVSPEASETCSGVDDDCDGDVDEGFSVLTMWPDNDGDGFGDVLGQSSEVCDGTEGWADNNADCFDGFADRQTGVWFEGDTDLRIDEMATWQASGDGLVRVCPGTWTVALQVTGHEVSIEGIGGRDVAVLDGAGEHRVLVVEQGADVTLNALTLSNGYAHTSAAHGGYGGAALVTGATLELANVTVQDSFASERGGGVASRAGADLVLHDSVFINNTSDYGGAVALDDNSSSAAWTWERCSFEGNHADDHGGAIYIHEDVNVVLAMTDLEVNDNTAGVDGGGILWGGDGTLEVSSSQFSRNIADDDGGALHAQGKGDTLTLYQTDFLENEGGEGGALGVRNIDIDLEDCTFQQNEAKRTGGAIDFYGQGSTVALKGVEFTENTADQGALWIFSAQSMAWEDCLFHGNTGHAVYFETGNEGMSVDLEDCSFGADDTADDNSPFDLYFDFQSPYTYNAGDGVSFTCTSGQCQ
jgi:predicted outer membrane repeat protein